MKTLKFTKVRPGVYHAKFTTQKDLALSFLRFQEFYESPIFKDEVFTVRQFKKWYIPNYGKGKWNYASTWEGFNVPDYVWDFFQTGAFNPLDVRETALLKEVAKIKDKKFTVIGTYADAEYALFEHECAHALFYTNARYRANVLKIINKAERQKKLVDLYATLKRKMYHESVWKDESHAYLMIDYGYIRGVWKVPLGDTHIDIASSLRKNYDRHFSK